jgi:hypothetical protein
VKFARSQLRPRGQRERSQKDEGDNDPPFHCL